ncbi:MAG: hypothetical protein KC503_26510 [Myxococcales bacterium]|nr:hypothetical protein [Myxococcales bacterium]
MSEQQKNAATAGAQDEAEAPQAQDLVEAEKMATLGRLLAGIAHEINTPLGAVRSNNDMLDKAIEKFEAMVESGGEISDRKLRRLLSTIHNLTETNATALDRITRIVTGLKRYAHRNLEKQNVDLRDVLEMTLTLVHHELKYRIEVHQHVSADLPRISGYPSQLSQVLTNLLVNAAQAIQGKGRIDISMAARDADDGSGREVVITVSDDGPGIPDDVMQRIFEAGFTTKPEGVGSGLGLAISMEILQRHGGRMEVESEPGKGATFRVILPAL